MEQRKKIRLDLTKTTAQKWMLNIIRAGRTGKKTLNKNSALLFKHYFLFSTCLSLTIVVFEYSIVKYFCFKEIIILISHYSRQWIWIHRKQLNALYLAFEIYKNPVSSLTDLDFSMELVKYSVFGRISSVRLNFLFLTWIIQSAEFPSIAQYFPSENYYFCWYCLARRVK